MVGQPHLLGPPNPCSWAKDAFSLSAAAIFKGVFLKVLQADLVIPLPGQCSVESPGLQERKCWWSGCEHFTQGSPGLIHSPDSPQY